MERTVELAQTYFRACVPSSAADAHVRLVAAYVVVAVFFICTTLAGDTVAHLTGHDHLMGLIPMFSVRVEGNLPTLFQAMLLVHAGLLAASIATKVRRWKLHWAFLGVVMIFLSMDEAFAIHERLNAPLRDAYGVVGILYFPWVVPYGVLTTVFALSYLRFLLALPERAGRRMFWGGALYVGGALGIEIVQGGWYLHAGPDATYRMIWLVGETMEMAGMILFLYTLLALRVSLMPARTPRNSPI